MLFAFSVRPEAQSRSRTHRARSADDHTKEIAEKLLSWVHTQFPSRCENRFRQHLKSAKLLQGETEINLFTGKVLLIETADRIETAPCCEKKRAGTEIEPKVHDGKKAQQNAPPQRNESIHRYACAAAGVTFFQRSDRFENMRARDTRVGVNEEHVLTLRSATARISGGGNLASIDSDDFCTSVKGDLWRAIR